MKILDRYVLGLYLKRLGSVFLILMFIFIIQTFWLFIDEFAGKGIDSEIILKFLGYYSPKLYPLVMPLSVLLASIMTYGTLAENYEFAAMKSTGISLQRAMRSLVIFHFFLGVGSFYFANHVIPYGEFKYYNLRRNLAKLKPALAITEGVFNDIGEMNIKVKRKHGEDNRFLEDVIIHEKTADKKNRIVIKANRGELKSATIGDQLQLILYDGNRYEEINTSSSDPRNRARPDRQIPHAKVAFKKYIMNIDLSQFNDVDLAEEKYRSTYRMQKVNELVESIDSLEEKFLDNRKVYGDNFAASNLILKLKNNKDLLIEMDSLSTSDSVYRLFKNPLRFAGIDNFVNQKEVLRQALSSNRGHMRNVETKKRSYFLNQKRINLHKNTFHEKFTLGFSLFFLFLVGSSLGAIIRKGGLGLPMVLAILIFLTYYYIGLFGKNASEDSSISPVIGSWVSVFIIAPCALYFLHRASRDLGLLNNDRFLIFVDQLVEVVKNRIFALRNTLWKKNN